MPAKRPQRKLTVFAANVLNWPPGYGMNSNQSHAKVATGANPQPPYLPLCGKDSCG